MYPVLQIDLRFIDILENLLKEDVIRIREINVLNNTGGLDNDGEEIY